MIDRGAAPKHGFHEAFRFDALVNVRGTFTISRFSRGFSVERAVDTGFVIRDSLPFRLATDAADFSHGPHDLRLEVNPPSTRSTLG